MIAPVKKSVSHSRTVARLGTRRLSSQRFDRVEMNSLLVLLVVAFFAVTHGYVELTFPFLLVLRLSLDATFCITL